MAKGYKLTESNVPEWHAKSLYAGIIADFLAQGTESMQVTIEGMKPATLRAGLRRASKGVDGVKLAQGVSFASAPTLVPTNGRNQHH